MPDQRDLATERSEPGDADVLARPRVAPIVGEEQLAPPDALPWEELQARLLNAMATRTPKTIDADADDLIITHGFKFMGDLAVEAVQVANKRKRRRVEPSDVDKAKERLDRSGLRISTLQAVGGILFTIALTFFGALITGSLEEPSLFWVLFGVFAAVGGLCIAAPFLIRRKTEQE